MGQEENICRILIRRHEGKRALKDMIRDQRIVLKWILQ
jgi:hypothetical protein